MASIAIGAASPFFIVSDAVAAASFYRDKLGFDIRLLAPDDSPFFAIVGRGSAQLFLKAVAHDIAPMPNRTRAEWAPWDAFIYVDEPLALAQDFVERGASLHQEVHAREDGLRGFEVRDEDGYLLFFGRPA